MSDLETTGWYAVGIPIIAATIAIEWALARRREGPRSASGAPAFGFAEAISNLSAGLGTLLIGIFVGPILFAGWEAVHALAPFPWDGGSLWRWPAALALADLCYYLWHRAGHRFALLWAIHGVHHQHERLNTTVGLRLEWLADPFAALFFVAMPLAGCDAITGYAAIAVLSLYTLTTHSQVLDRPSLGVLVTPASHGAHHSRDARYADANYGAMLNVWDRLLGTFRAPVPRAALRADVPTVARVHDGVAGQWVLVGELLGGLRRARSPRALLRGVAGPPAMRAHPGPRDDVVIAAEARAYLLASFVGAVVFSTWLLWGRDGHSWALLVLGSLAAIWTLRTIGGFLDGRPGAAWEELLRLAACGGLGALLLLEAPVAGAAVIIGCLVAIAALPRCARGSALARVKRERSRLPASRAATGSCGAA